MTTTYIWKIIALDTVPTLNNFTDVVTTAHWSLQGTNGVTTASLQGISKFGNTVSNNGITPVSVPDYPNLSAFVNFALLTENQVIAWVKNDLGLNTIASLQNVIESQIQNQTNPTTLPWA